MRQVIFIVFRDRVIFEISYAVNQFYISKFPFLFDCSTENIQFIRFSYSSS